MRRLLILIPVLWCATASASFFALVQKVATTTCASGNSCVSAALSSTGTGHLLFVTWAGTSGGFTLNSITGEGTWTRCNLGSGAGVGISYASAGGTIGCAYIFSATGGTTSITLNWSGTVTSAFSFYEYSCNGGACTNQLAIDGNCSGSTTNCTRGQTTTTNPVGVAMTITGANDLVIQWTGAQVALPSAIGTYADFLSNGVTNWLLATADLLNTTSGAAPTWTSASGSFSLGGFAFTQLQGGPLGGGAKIGGGAVL